MQEQRLTPGQEEVYLTTLNDYERIQYEVWKDEYVHYDVSLADFMENYTYCSLCDSWDNTQCICYAR